MPYYGKALVPMNHHAQRIQRKDHLPIQTGAFQCFNNQHSLAHTNQPNTSLAYNCSILLLQTAGSESTKSMKIAYKPFIIRVKKG